jgi:hypothetical protein
MSMQTERTMSALFAEDLGARPPTKQQNGQPAQGPSSFIGPIDTAAADPLVSTTGHRAPYDYPVPLSKISSKK